MHRFLCGVENLNLMLQEQLNPKKNQDELKYSSQTFRVGDKVMHIRNNYQKNVFNGDIGFIQDINNEKLTVDYFDHIVTYEKNELNELTLAYASSVHKSQGSEYKSSHHSFINKSLHHAPTKFTLYSYHQSQTKGHHHWLEKSIDDCCSKQSNTKKIYTTC